MALDRWLGPDVLRGMLAQVGARGAAPSTEGLRDVGTLRGFLVGPAVHRAVRRAVAALFVALIWLFHPLLGGLALAGALVMLGAGRGSTTASRAAAGARAGEGRRAGRFIDAATRNGGDGRLARHARARWRGAGAR